MSNAESEQWKLDRIDQSIGRLFDRVGCSIGLKSVRTSIRSAGWLDRLVYNNPR
ncbi:hypothetical protein HanIR_Chr15g0729261 [Helianthus annuus]|nr:hypothetical protein HanIR_Chr15g0729261 [Helianthus annuus]